MTDGIDAAVPNSPMNRRVFEQSAEAALRALGIEDCAPSEKDARECVDEAIHSLDMLLHHGSRFIGRSGEAQNEWFLDALGHLRVRMLVQHPVLEREVTVFRDLAKRFPDFSYAFYSGRPLVRAVIIDRGRVCYLSHYANEVANRAEGSRSSIPSPQMRLSNTEQASLSYLADRMFEELWGKGVTL